MRYIHHRRNLYGVNDRIGKIIMGRGLFICYGILLTAVMSVNATRPVECVHAIPDKDCYNKAVTIWVNETTVQYICVCVCLCRPDTYLFHQKTGYDSDPSQEKCHSFDFNMTANVTPIKGDPLKYCEEIIGSEPSDKVICDGNASILEVAEFDNQWICYTFTATVGLEAMTKFVWFSNEKTPSKAVIASSCKGEPPLDMYRSDVSHGKLTKLLNSRSFSFEL